MQTSRKKILVIGDTLQKLKTSADSSLALVQAALEQTQMPEVEVWWCEPQDITLIGTSAVATSAQRITGFEGRKFFTEAPSPTCAEPPSKSVVELSAFMQIWVRKDPPFDEAYKSLCWVLASQENTFVCNPATVLLSMHEKAIPFLAHNQGILARNEITPTYLLQPGTLEKSLVHLKRFVNDENNGAGWIVKPWQGHGGRDIRAFDSAQKLLENLQSNSDSFSNSDALSDSNSVGQRDVHNFVEPLMIQPLLREIESRGDRRVIVTKGEIICHFARYAAHPNQAANLAQGGKAVLQDFTAEESSIVHRLAKWLWSRNVYFAGIDLIGSKVTEVNITSPTGLRTYEDLTGKNVAMRAVELLLKQN